MLVLFAILIAPLLFFLVTWVAATAYRLYFPERPLPFRKDPVVLRRRAAATGSQVPVGFREIRQDQLRLQRERMKAPYFYAGSASEGLPSDWMDDLWRRRN